MNLSTDPQPDSTPDGEPGDVGGGIGDTDSSPILRASTGAVLGGVLSASVWAAVSAFLGMEIGILATLTGICTGVGVAVVSRGERGTPFRVIAVLGSLLGILLGKYASYWFVLRRSVLEQYGPGALKATAPWAPEFVSSFVENWQASFGGFDLVWIGLAVVAAWKGVDLAAQDVLRRRKTATAAFR
jgi:hypothetical protein